MKTVLITGPTGFVGTHLTERLLNEGVSVVAAVRNPTDDRLPAGTRAISFNLEEPGALEPSALKGIDCIYHLAAMVHVMRPSASDERRFHQMNVESTNALARAAAAAGVRRFVLVSSIKVNGESSSPGQPINIDQPPRPEDAYGRSKAAAEEALVEVGRETGLETVIVRPPLVYGPGVGANFARLMGLVKLGLPLPFGSIANRRSLVNVWNLVDLLVLLGHHPEATGRWLVSDESDYSTAELVHQMGLAMGRPVRLLQVPVSFLVGFAKLLGKGAEISRLCGSLQVDSSRTRDMLGWFPPVAAADGIARTVEWFCAQGSQR
jgi:nucleoside-diphosphate-sugar epimerase